VTSQVAANVSFCSSSAPQNNTNSLLNSEKRFTNKLISGIGAAKMGIKQLFSIIKDEAPDAIKEGDIKNQFGRKVAIVSGCVGSLQILG
jgi:flap endonuclease-1